MATSQTYPELRAALGEAAPLARPRLQRALGAAWWTCRLLLGLFVFVGALQVMKTGAASLDILHQGSLLVKNAGSSLGLGWIGAMLVLSGSPIAASSLTLVAAGSISELQGFAMLNGSRLGAAFVVLLVAVIYALRDAVGQRRKPVSIGVIALSTTALAYVPGGILGFALLHWEAFQQLNVQLPAQFGDLVDLVYGGLLERVRQWPAPLLFVGGLGILLLSFRLLDSVLPEMGEDSLAQTRFSWVRRKWPMFGLGCVVALITMSVSVALTALVPLVARGRVNREDIIPYIMGANITTLGDTLLAAFLLDSASAVRVVLADILGVSTVTLLLLTFAYAEIKSASWELQHRIVASRARLAGFTAALFLVPVGLIAVSAAIG